MFAVVTLDKQVISEESTLLLCSSIFLWIVMQGLYMSLLYHGGLGISAVLDHVLMTERQFHQ